MWTNTRISTYFLPCAKSNRKLGMENVQYEKIQPQYHSQFTVYKHFDSYSVDFRFSHVTRRWEKERSFIHSKCIANLTRVFFRSICVIQRNIKICCHKVKQVEILTLVSPNRNMFGLPNQKKRYTHKNTHSCLLRVFSVWRFREYWRSCRFFFSSGSSFVWFSFYAKNK